MVDPLVKPKPITRIETTLPSGGFPFGAFAEDVLRALKEHLFLRNGEVVQVEGVKLVRVGVHDMRVLVEKRCDVFDEKVGKNGQTFKVPVPLITETLASALLSAARMSPHVREINTVVSTPCLLPSGSLVRPGFNDGGFYFVESSWNAAELAKMTDIATALAKWPVRKIKRLLAAWLRDFPFETLAKPGDRARKPYRDNAIGMVFTMFARAYIPGVTPFFLGEATLPGTGKSLFVKSTTGLCYDSSVAARSYPSDEEEMKKSLVSALRGGSPCIFIDNIAEEIRSSSLAMLATAPRFTARILGRTSDFECENKIVLCGTSNKAVLGPDMQRRTVVIKLKPSTAHPELRSRDEFWHPEILEFTQECRMTLMAALYSMFLRWEALGEKPEPKNLMGSFEAWHRFVGSVLLANGFRDFMWGWSSAIPSSETIELSKFLEGVMLHAGVKHATGPFPVPVPFNAIIFAAQESPLLNRHVRYYLDDNKNECVREKETKASLGQHLPKLLGEEGRPTPIEAHGRTWVLEKKGRGYELRLYA